MAAEHVPDDAGSAKGRAAYLPWRFGRVTPTARSGIRALPGMRAGYAAGTTCSPAP